MSWAVFLRLSAMAFLHYFVWGAWYTTMSSYLTDTLHFNGNQNGLAYGTTAIGALVSPFVAGVLADRYFATQKLLALLHLVGGVLLLTISQVTTFPIFYPMLIAYTISYMAGHGLINSLTLHHSPNPAREFPLVMLSASVGWICSGLLISSLQLESSHGIFQLAAVAALLMGFYSLTLPHTPPRGGQQSVNLRAILGLDALRLMRNRSFAVFIVCSFLVCIPLSFYFAWMSVFLKELGIENVAAKMSLAQVSDVIFLLLLPVLVPRLGAKGILVVGMLAWAIRFLLLAWFYQQPGAHWMMYLAIALHGMCYDFIFVMGRMYVDKRAAIEIRGAAQGLHAFVTLGAGMFIGSWLSGVIGEANTIAGIDGQSLHNWTAIWMVPAGLAAILSIVFALFFHDRPAEVEGVPVQGASAST